MVPPLEKSNFVNTMCNGVEHAILKGTAKIEEVKHEIVSANITG
jgi:hypothetical protein